MNELITLLKNSAFVKIALLTIVIDVFLGTLRAIKEKKFNSCVGIDGAIRKVAMIGCISFLMVADMLIHINVIRWIPTTVTNFIGVGKIGLCEFFCLLFSIYEIISISKNAILCDLPFPTFVKVKLEDVLEDLTGELDNKEEK